MTDGLYPIIEWLVFKKDLRAKIRDLRAKNELDIGGYSRLRKMAAFRVVFNIGLPLFLYVLIKVGGAFGVINHVPPAPSMEIAIIVIILLAYSSMRSYELTRAASCFNLGIPLLATISGTLPAGIRTQHSITYKFSYNNREWRAGGGGMKFSFKYGVYLRSKEDQTLMEHFPFPERGLSVGDTIIIFIIPNKSKKPESYIYFENFFNQVCINKNTQELWRSELIAAKEFWGQYIIN